MFCIKAFKILFYFWFGTEATQIDKTNKISSQTNARTTMTIIVIII